MITKQPIIKKPRGHRKENILRNQALVSLHICGFNNYRIANLLKMDKRNASRFVKKYYSKYSGTILEKISQHFLSFKKYIGK